MKATMIFGAMFLSAISSAEVISQANEGFHIKSSVSVPVSAMQAYHGFLDIGSWWIEDHTWFGKAANLSLDPVAGGCFCEIDGDRQVQHMTVAYVNPGKAVRLTGGLGPLQQMGVSGTLSFQFVGISDTETMIVQEYRVSGYYSEGLDTLAAVVDQVQTAQLLSLQKRFVDES